MPRVLARGKQAVVKYMAGEEVPSEVLIPKALYRRADAEKDSALK